MTPAGEPVPTFGLTHLALAVEDVERAFEFYRALFGMVAVYRDDGLIQAQTPGSRDVLVLERAKNSGQMIGTTGSIAHFGFRLREPGAIADAAAKVVAAGGTVIDQGDFCPGEPYLFARDRDGYIVEIWYELPTMLDPPPPAH